MDRTRDAGLKAAFSHNHVAGTFVAEYTVPIILHEWIWDGMIHYLDFVKMPTKNMLNIVSFFTAYRGTFVTDLHSDYTRFATFCLSVVN